MKLAGAAHFCFHVRRHLAVQVLHRCSKAEGKLAALAA
jgi:hypothetical protein